ncbi:hypothetical protein CAMSH0001_1656 [Campylobacter showae RM3277]|uniref:Uncharacterized protein n=1 Tax=Campylobacter showae RM3277 TaxID=553219 RepID=C6RH22_9BACT|nr:hypothetical protein CAMSH0001_1656 [Campylobacter showae RM3277]
MSFERFLRSWLKFSSADYLCFALLATASRGLAYAKFYLRNPKNHLKILRLIIVAFKFEAKFANFSFKFYPPRPAS